MEKSCQLKRGKNKAVMTAGFTYRAVVVETGHFDRHCQVFLAWDEVAPHLITRNG
jgi:hypothetical protein